jgi:hypothetical protein
LRVALLETKIVPGGRAVREISDFFAYSAILLATYAELVMWALPNFLVPRTADDRVSEIRDARANTASAVFVADRRFWQQLQSLRELKSFLLSEGVVFTDADLDAIQLGELDRLAFSPRGRIPSIDEWREIDKKMNALGKYLNYPLRRKRTLLRLRPYFRTFPLIFLSVAIIALFADSCTRYLLDKQGNLNFVGTILDFAANLAWILALGGLGTCGYLGTSLMAESRRVATLPASPSPTTSISPATSTSPAISTPDHSTSPQSSAHLITSTIAEIDLTDANLIVTRIVVGLLFSFMLGYPVYQLSEQHPLHTLILGKGSDQNLIKIVGEILLPFILGFSTTLVLGIMERFVTAAGSLFGITTPR